MNTTDRLIVRAGPAREQDKIPCQYHALMHLKTARAHGLGWIRVEKPGHTCEFMVAALEQHVRDGTIEAPKCLVNLRQADHERFGGTFEPLTRRWSGASLVRAV